MVRILALELIRNNFRHLLIKASSNSGALRLGHHLDDILVRYL
jgi:hypothetical protein